MHLHISTSLFRAVGLCAILFLLASCQSKPTEIPVIDLDHPQGSIDIKLSDILDNITIVPLETRDDVLLTAAAHIVVSDHYILAGTRTKLFQFDRTGTYLRTLAHRGNGPNEFNTLANILVDDRNDLVYYTDNFKDPSLVYRINLKTGAFLTPITMELTSVTMHTIDREGYIIGYPLTIGLPAGGMYIGPRDQKAKNFSTLMFAYHPDNKHLKIVESHDAFSSIMSWEQTMLSYQDQLLFYHLGYSDTLYRYDGSRLVPQVVLKFQNHFSDLINGGNYLSFSAFYTGGICISIHYLEKMEEYHVHTTGKTINRVFLNTAHQIQTIGSVTIDPLSLNLNFSESQEIPVPINPLPKVTGQWGFLCTESYTMIELINTALINNHLTPLQHSTLKDVAAQIDDYSNPVLIIGKVK